jgi:hypothetical protein
LLNGFRLAKPSKLEERPFEPVCEGWLAVTKLGKEGPCGDFDCTEQRLRIEGDHERIFKRCQLFDRYVIYIVEEVGVEATTLLGEL